MTTVHPRLSGDAMGNRETLARLLEWPGPVHVEVPAGTWPIAGGLVLGTGHTLAGTEPGTTLVRTKLDPAPFLHLTGSGSAVADLSLDLPATNSGAHNGDERTAITIGRYLYPEPAAWLDGVRVERVRVRRRGRCAANSIAVMGAVRQVELTDLDITGGGTGIAVHWGAVGTSVSDIGGPSYHPNALRITRLRVSGAFEGFYLSSVHDVEVSDVRCDDVEIGFRLLPGDNGDRFHGTPGASEVSTRIAVTGCQIGWRGLYGMRIAGWGRSEVDRAMTRLRYRDVSVTGCRLVAGTSLEPHLTGRASVVLEDAEGVTLVDIDTGEAIDGVDEARIDGRATALVTVVAG